MYSTNFHFSETRLQAQRNSENLYRKQLCLCAMKLQETFRLRKLRFQHRLQLQERRLSQDVSLRLFLFSEQVLVWQKVLWNLSLQQRLVMLVHSAILKLLNLFFTTASSLRISMNVMQLFLTRCLQQVLLYVLPLMN